MGNVEATRVRLALHANENFTRSPGLPAIHRKYACAHRSMNAERFLPLEYGPVKLLLDPELSVPCIFISPSCDGLACSTDSSSSPRFPPSSFGTRYFDFDFFFLHFPLEWFHDNVRIDAVSYFPYLFNYNVLVCTLKLIKNLLFDILHSIAFLLYQRNEYQFQR